MEELVADDQEMDYEVPNEVGASSREDELAGLSRETEHTREAPAGRGLRRFVFTCFNYVVDSKTLEPALVAGLGAEKRIRAFVFGEELCPDTGSVHLQGYFETFNQHTFNAIRKWPCFLKEQPWLGGANGNSAQNEKYCKKEGVWWSGGTFAHAVEGYRKGQGKRNDWHVVHELAKRQATNVEFTDAVPALAYNHVNKLQAWRSIHAPVHQRSWNTVPVIAYGPPRAGKSTWIKAEAAKLLAANPGWRIYTKSDAEKWWPEYTGQEVILIDEMNGSFFEWSRLKRFFDNAPFTVDVKNQPQVQFLGRYVFMTCNEDAHPAWWYPRHPGAKCWDESNALWARIEEFGQFWTFIARHRLQDGTWQFFPPNRDLVLRSPGLPPQVIQELDRDRQHF